MDILISLSCFLAGSLLTLLIFLAPLGRLKKNKALLEGEKSQLENRLSELKTRLALEARSREERETFMKSSREDMNRQFELMANRIFEEKSRSFTSLNSEKLNALLQPFNNRIEIFQRQVEKTYTRNVEDASRLKTQIEQLTKLNQQVGEEAQNLTRALKGQSQTQGAWGEMVMESVLERSGLKRGDQYETQKSFNDDEGQRFRPDGIVHLPGERDIIIDAKVSLNAYDGAVNATSDFERDEAVKAHVQSVRAHVRELEGKDYSRLPGINTIDLVLMFIPIEGAFSLAVQGDNSLFTEAFEKRIIIVSPTTLFATLKTVESSWRYEAQNRNAREIARKAGMLYDKLVNFTADLEKVDRALDTARRASEEAGNKLVQGKGNLIRRAEELRELGAAPSKQLPKKLTDLMEE
ncbi:MAG: DNA recombination protein RmuC [Spirochaetales bacterium]|nr:DNA recombination protein RmuC [Spirochaetales bacterium]